MLCPPTMRPVSPAESEISVGGAPSPMPSQHHHHQLVQPQLSHALQTHHAHQQVFLQHQLMQQHAAAAAAAASLTRSAVGAMSDEYFQPLKRLRVDTENSERTPSPAQLLPPPLPTSLNTNTTMAKSQIEGVKSFSIADILGHHADANKRASTPNSPSSVTPTTVHAGISLSSVNTNTLMHPAAAAILLPGGSPMVRPWDHLLAPLPMRPFMPANAFYNYEQRLALDYHRQLRDHFNAQAHLLRQMGVDIIPSESGSDRSSSAASDCCSPDVGPRSSSESANATVSRHHTSSTQQANTERSANEHSNNNNNNNKTGNSSANDNAGNNGNTSVTNAKTKPNGTPLDALFQMTTKDFDESQGQLTLSLFFLSIILLIIDY